MRICNQKIMKKIMNAHLAGMESALIAQVSYAQLSMSASCQLYQNTRINTITQLYYNTWININTQLNQNTRINTNTQLYQNTRINTNTQLYQNVMCIHRLIQIITYISLYSFKYSALLGNLSKTFQRILSVKGVKWAKKAI